MRLEESSETADKVTIWFQANDDITGEPLNDLKCQLLYNYTDSTQFELTELGDWNRITLKRIKGPYRLVIEKEGYITGFKDFKVRGARTGTQTLPPIPMGKLKIRQLDEVTVTPTRVKMVMKGDTIVYDASAFNLAEGSMLDALVSQLPGAEITNGQIKVNGKFIESLLVNGEDFFSGNPTVALQNLPAYSVKNVKVYDRKTKDAYLTQGKRPTTEEHIVMDVNLKKKYSYGWLANVTGGYGSDDRYQGKFLGLGYREDLRIATYANLNNISDQSRGYSTGEWQAGDKSEGQLTHKEGGLDYLWKKRDFKFNGNAIIFEDRPDVVTDKSSVSYYDTGDIYGRSMSHKKEKSFRVWTGNNWSWSGKNAYIELKPMIDYSKSSSNSMFSSANFSQPIYESWRGEALDSILGGSNLFTNSLLNFTNQKSNKDYHHFCTETKGEATIQIPGYLDFIKASALFYYIDQHSTPYNRLDQTLYSGNGISRSTESYLQKTTYHFVNRHTNADAFYCWVSSKERDKDLVAYALMPGITIDHTNSLTDNAYFQILQNATSLTPPSATDWGNLPADLKNSNCQHLKTTTVSPELMAQYEWNANSEFEDKFQFVVTAKDNIKYERMAYLQAHYAPDMHRTKHLPVVDAEIIRKIQTANKYTTFNLSYKFSTDAPIYLYSLAAENTFNPKNHYIYGADLKNSATHTAKFDFYQYLYAKNRVWGANIKFEKQENAVALAKYYDRNTDVNTWTPVNINGNWNLDGSVYYTLPFGPSQMWNFNGRTTARHLNSVDYATETSELTRSVVGNTALSQQAGLSLTKKGNTYGLKGKVEWLHAVSRQHLFTTIDAWTYNLRAETVINLPYTWQISTDFGMYARKGYQDPTMNDTDWVWNAKVSKSFLKGALTAQVEGIDILGQISNVTHKINAQGRTETWVNSIPRYVMLSLTYRFNILNKK